MSQHEDDAAQAALEATEPIRALRLFSVKQCLDELRRAVSDGRITGVAVPPENEKAG